MTAIQRRPASRTVAIHQPNFLPWLGFFSKLAQADVFLLLDNTQFPKTGGCWSNRVRMLVNGVPAWLTVPIVRSYHGVRQIAEMKINEQTAWRTKMAKTLEASYRRAPYFGEVWPLLEEVIGNETDNLADYNRFGIVRIAQALGLETSKIMIGSTLAADGRATQLLINMVRAVGGDTYMCGGGAAEYQQDAAFPEAGLTLRYQQFEHPLYPQFNRSEFVPGLSVVDAVMNCGFEHVRTLID